MNHEIAYIRQAYKKHTLSNRALLFFVYVYVCVLTLFNYFLFSDYVYVATIWWWIKMYIASISEAQQVRLMHAVYHSLL